MRREQRLSVGRKKVDSYDRRIYMLRLITRFFYFSVQRFEEIIITRTSSVEKTSTKAKSSTWQPHEVGLLLGFYGFGKS